MYEDNYLYCSNLETKLCPIGEFPATDWRNDTQLTTPRLIFPRDGAVICLDNAIGLGANITLEWSLSAGATFYVLEICNNSSFKGPTLRSIKTASTSYSLIKGVDIRLDETLFWRVMSLNGIGGVSTKSPARQLSYDCGDFRESRPTEGGSQGFDSSNQGRCSDYDVVIDILGNSWMYCCDKAAFPLEYSHICTDQLGREVARVVNVEWSVRSNPDEPDAVTVEGYENEKGCGAIVEVCGECSQIFELIVTITFDDFVIGDQFTCQFKKDVYVDCEVPVGDKPWAGGNPYNVLYIDRILPRDVYTALSYDIYDNFQNSPYVAYGQGNYDIILTGPIVKVYDEPKRDCLCDSCLNDPRDLKITFADQSSLTLSKVDGECTWESVRLLSAGEILDSPDCGPDEKIAQTVRFRCEGNNLVGTIKECCTDCIGVDCCPDPISNNLEIQLVIDTVGILIDIENTAGTWYGCNGTTCAELECVNGNWKLTIEFICMGQAATVIWTGPSILASCEPDGSLSITLREKTVKYPDPDACPNQEVSGLIVGDATACNETNCETATYMGKSICLPLDSLFMGEGLSVPFLLTRVGAGEECNGCSTVFGSVYERDVIYEARVRLPVGCGLKWNNGVLELDLDAIIAPDRGLYKVGDCQLGAYTGGVYNTIYIKNCMYCYGCYDPYPPFEPPVVGTTCCEGYLLPTELKLTIERRDPVSEALTGVTDVIYIRQKSATEYGDCCTGLSDPYFVDVWCPWDSPEMIWFEFDCQPDGRWKLFATERVEAFDLETGTIICACPACDSAFAEGDCATFTWTVSRIRANCSGETVLECLVDVTIEPA